MGVVQQPGSMPAVRSLQAFRLAAFGAMFAFIGTFIGCLLIGYAVLPSVVLALIGAGTGASLAFVVGIIDDIEQFPPRL